MDLPDYAPALLQPPRSRQALHRAELWALEAEAEYRKTGAADTAAAISQAWAAIAGAHERRER